jgi:hypothetical protein
LKSSDFGGTTNTVHSKGRPAPLTVDERSVEALSGKRGTAVSKQEGLAGAHVTNTFF